MLLEDEDLEVEDDELVDIVLLFAEEALTLDDERLDVDDEELLEIMLLLGEDWLEVLLTDVRCVCVVVGLDMEVLLLCALAEIAKQSAINTNKILFFIL